MHHGFVDTELAIDRGVVEQQVAENDRPLHAQAAGHAQILELCCRLEDALAFLLVELLLPTAQLVREPSQTVTDETEYLYIRFWLDGGAEYNVVQSQRPVDACIGENEAVLESASGEVSPMSQACLAPIHGAFEHHIPHDHRACD